MEKWSFQQEVKREERALNKTRRENLSKFIYDLAKLVFAGVVIGGIIQLYANPNDLNLWEMVFCGVFGTFLIAFYANRILK